MLRVTAPSTFRLYCSTSPGWPALKKQKSSPRHLPFDTFSSLGSSPAPKFSSSLSRAEDIPSAPKSSPSLELLLLPAQKIRPHPASSLTSSCSLPFSLPLASPSLGRSAPKLFASPAHAFACFAFHSRSFHSPSRKPLLDRNPRSIRSTPPLCVESIRPRPARFFPLDKLLRSLSSFLTFGYPARDSCLVSAPLHREPVRLTEATDRSSSLASLLLATPALLTEDRDPRSPPLFPVP